MLGINGKAGKEVLLIRHGETDWNVAGRFQGHADIPLNANGIQLAYSVAKNLRDLKIEHIISSDLSRAAETARIINRDFNVEITLDSRLRERNMCPLEGMTLEEISGIAGRKITISEFVGEDFSEKVESLSSLRERIRSFVSDLIGMNFGRCLIVGHGGSLAIMISQIAGIPHEKIHFENCEIKKLIMAGNNCVIEE